MATSLKISNVFENREELTKRLKSIKSPGKAKLAKALATNDWKSIYTELLYRIELYTSLKVLNYTKKDVNDIAMTLKTKKLSIADVVENIVAKLPVEALMESQALEDDDELLSFIVDEDDEFGLDEGFEPGFNNINT